MDKKFIKYGDYYYLKDNKGLIDVSKAYIRNNNGSYSLYNNESKPYRLDDVVITPKKEYGGKDALKDSIFKKALRLQYDKAKKKVLKTIEGAGKILQLPQAAMIASLVETNPVMKARYIGTTGRTDVGLQDLFSKNHDDLKPSTIVNSKSDIVNLGSDIILDPLNIIGGVGALSKGLSSASKISKGLSTTQKAEVYSRPIIKEVSSIATGGLSDMFIPLKNKIGFKYIPRTLNQLKYNKAYSNIREATDNILMHADGIDRSKLYKKSKKAKIVQLDDIDNQDDIGALSYKDADFIGIAVGKNHNPNKIPKGIIAHEVGHEAQALLPDGYNKEFFDPNYHYSKDNSYHNTVLFEEQQSDRIASSLYGPNTSFKSKTVKDRFKKEYGKSPVIFNVKEINSFDKNNIEVLSYDELYKILPEDYKKAIESKKTFDRKDNFLNKDAKYIYDYTNGSIYQIIGEKAYPVFSKTEPSYKFRVNNNIINTNNLGRSIFTTNKIITNENNKK